MTEYDCTICLFLLFSIRSMANKKNLGTFFKPAVAAAVVVAVVVAAAVVEVAAEATTFAGPEL